VEVMKEFEIPMKLVRLVKINFASTNSKVKIQGKLIPSFETKIGLQGNSLSSILFNLCMEKLIRNIRINQGGKIFIRTRQCLAFADDIVILGRSEGYINGTLEEMATITHQIDLQMNDTKTIYMINRHDGNKINKIELMGKRYEKVESFKHLGSVMTSLNDIEREIKIKIAVDNKCYYALGTILKSRSIFQSIKIRLHKRIIRPAVIYGVETWTLTSKTEKMLMTY
jgi:hypothetical protein